MKSVNSPLESVKTSFMKLIIVFLIILLPHFVTGQNMIYVPDDYSTIQLAIDNSNDFDTIVVKEGVYFENIKISNKKVYLTSELIFEADSSYITNTIIDGKGETVFSIDSCESGDVVINGFTIRNGDDGIFTYSQIDILNNNIRQCKDGIDYESGSGGKCKYNIIEDNIDDAVDFDGSVNIILEDNILRNNGDDGIELRLHEYNGELLEYVIRRNIISGNGEDGIQLIDYPDTSDRVIHIEFNYIIENQMAGIGMMSNGNTVENYEGAQIIERVYLINNTIDFNYHGVVGGGNMLGLNNIISNSTYGCKNIASQSIMVNTYVFDNDTNYLNSNIDIASFYNEKVNFINFYEIPVSSPVYKTGFTTYNFHGEQYTIDMEKYYGTYPDVGAYQANGSILKGPYIIPTNNNRSVFINWQLGHACTLELKWGKDSANLLNSVSIDNLDVDSIFHYKINNLYQNRRYFYEIIENDVVHKGSFYTGLSSMSNLNIYILGDTRTNIGSFNRVASEINHDAKLDSVNGTLVIHTGDWNSSSTDFYWENEFFNRKYKEVCDMLSNIPILGVLGNHDLGDNKEIFRKYMNFPFLYDTTEYYLLSTELADLIFLDQYSFYEINSQQYLWLNNFLENSNKKWKLIFFHEPIYGSGPHQDNLVFREIYQPLFEKYNCIVFTGHNHNYSHNEINNVHYFTVGGGGAPLYNVTGGDGVIYAEKSLCFMKAIFSPDLLTLEARRADGSIMEVVEISSVLSVGEKIKDKFQIYPNPATDFLYIEGISNVENTKYLIEIYNISGKLLYQKKISDKYINALNISNLPTGIYICKIQSNLYSKSYKFTKIQQ